MKNADIEKSSQLVQIKEQKINDLYSEIEMKEEELHTVSQYMKEKVSSSEGIVPVLEGQNNSLRQ